MPGVDGEGQLLRRVLAELDVLRRLQGRGEHGEGCDVRQALRVDVVGERGQIAIQLRDEPGQAHYLRQLRMRIREDGFDGEVKRYQAHFVLIRPDHFVAWTSLDEQLASHLPKQVLSLARGAFEI